MNKRLLMNKACIIIILLLTSQSLYAISNDDVYKKILEMEQEMKDAHEDVVARISYNGNIHKARADLCDLRSEKYFLLMENYGGYYKEEQVTEYERIAHKRFKQCLSLSMILDPLMTTFEERLPLFILFDCYGLSGSYVNLSRDKLNNPYVQVALYLIKEKELLGKIKQRALETGHSDDFVDSIIEKLTKETK